MELNPPQKTHKKYIYVWNNSHVKLTGNWRKRCYITKVQERTPHNLVGRTDIKGIESELAPWEGSIRKKREGSHEWTFALGNEQAELLSGHPSCGIPHRRDRLPCLLGNPLRQQKGRRSLNSTQEECKHAGLLT